jgi:hypothetical protein
MSKKIYILYIVQEYKKENANPKISVLSLIDQNEKKKE